MDILLLIVGLGLILAGANFLTDGSAAVAQRFRVPEFIIGLTIVAVGTSTPELVVSVLSAAAGNSDVAIGNVVGSNLFNVFLILGVCALIRPLPLTQSNIRRDIPFGMAASLILLAVTSDRLICAGAADRIGRIDGIVMVALYIALMWFTIRTTKRPEAAPADAGAKKPAALWLAVVMIAGGLAGLIFGGDMFLKSATEIARRLGISESVIAITLVAGGTSLPELASSVVSLLKGKSEMALGNVIGSNIANILLILGVSATIRPLTMGGITTTDILMVVLRLPAVVADSVHLPKEADRPLGGRDLPDDIRRLYLVSDTLTEQIHAQNTPPAAFAHKTNPCLGRDFSRLPVQIAVDQPRHGIVAQRGGRHGGEIHRERDLDAVEHGMQRLVREPGVSALRRSAADAIRRRPTRFGTLPKRLVPKNPPHGPSRSSETRTAPARCRLPRAAATRSGRRM